MRLVALLLALVFVVVPLTASAQTAPNYELWVVDQADANVDGSRIYIYPRASLVGSAVGAPSDVVNLETASQGVGAGFGTRPHLLLFNNRHTHALLAYVASGHVQVIRASDRKVVASIDVGEQAHGAVAAPDDSFILVANQNGKKMARIRADFAREQFTHEVAADLDLKTIEGPDRPDNAPICPVLFAGANKAYVTLRGGGLAIVNTASTPMSVIKTFTKDQVAPAGCGGTVHGSKMYINSGTATSGNLYVFDLNTDNLVKSIPMTPTGTDSHGVALLGGGKYLWAANRGDGDNMVVVDTARDEIVGRFAGFGAAPDLIDVSPDGTRAFLTLRGPMNLTGGAPAKGETPGFAAINVNEDGRSGSRAFFAPIGAQGAGTRADPHALAVRRLAAQAAPAQLPRTGFPVDLALGLGGALAICGAALRLRRA